MGTSALGPPRTTTVFAGVGISVAALLWLLTDPVFGFLFLTGPIPRIGSAIILLAAMATLAFGTCGESSIVGSSIVGTVALLVFGARNLVFELLVMIPFTGDALPVVRGVSSGLSVLFVVALAVAAASVVRASVLHGFARWILLGVVTCYAIITTLSLIPQAGEVGYVLLAVWQVWLAVPASLLILGITYVFQGQSVAVLRWLRTVHDKW